MSKDKINNYVFCKLDNNELAERVHKRLADTFGLLPTDISHVADTVLLRIPPEDAEDFNVDGFARVVFKTEGVNKADIHIAEAGTVQGADYINPREDVGGIYTK